MRKAALYFTMVAIPVVGVVGAIYVRSVFAQAQLAVPPATPPTSWIPFAADQETITEKGALHRGRLYRRSDGSTRSEAFDAAGNFQRIDITDVSRKSYYSWTPKSGWTQHPIELPPTGWHPPTQAFRGRVVLSEKVEGLEAVRRDTRSGMYQIEIPQLNYFIVQGGCSDPSRKCASLRTFNIKVGEQPDAMFERPAGAPIGYSPEPRGIVKRTNPGDPRRER